MKQSVSAFVHFAALVACAMLCGCNRAEEKPAAGDTTVNLRSVVASPNRTHVATSFDVSGGGAAGFVYKCVNLRPATQPFAATAGVVFQMSGNAEPTIRWEANGMLIVEHPREATVYTSESEWKAESGTVQICYRPK